MWDYIIIGSGPAGLSFATFLTLLDKNLKILIIDREKSIGGCHRVRRTSDGMFTEHGPRIYINNYLTFKDIILKLALKREFSDLFNRYNFDMVNIGGTSIKSFKIREFLLLVYAFLRFTINPSWSQKITVSQFADYHHFSDSTKDYINRLCRLTDGAGSDRYTLFEFLQIFNQNIFYQIHQPKLPSDIGFLKEWHDYLLSTKQVTFLLNTEVTNLISSQSLNDRTNLLRGVQTSDNKKYLAKTIISAIPPKPMVKLLHQPSHPKTIQNAFGQLTSLVKWQEQSYYIPYIPVTYHWDQKVNFPKIWGFPQNEWGIVFVILTDYMDFKDPRSKTVVSTCITIFDQRSNVTGKTPHESNETELIEEIYRQLNFPDTIPNPSTSILSPGIYRNNATNKWETLDSSFVLTPAGYGPTDSLNFSNFHWISTHNGMSHYSFTSLETACSNALALAHKLYPKSKGQLPLRSPLSLTKIIFWLLLLLLLAIIIYKYYYQ